MGGRDGGASRSHSYGRESDGGACTGWLGVRSVEIADRSGEDVCGQRFSLRSVPVVELQRARRFCRQSRGGALCRSAAAAAVSLARLGSVAARTRRMRSETGRRDRASLTRHLRVGCLPSCIGPAQPIQTAISRVRPSVSERDSALLLPALPSLQPLSLRSRTVHVCSICSPLGLRHRHRKVRPVALVARRAYRRAQPSLDAPASR
jgi:hypothetical protein